MCGRRRPLPHSTLCAIHCVQNRRACRLNFFFSFIPRTYLHTRTPLYSAASNHYEKPCTNNIHPPPNTSQPFISAIMGPAVSRSPSCSPNSLFIPRLGAIVVSTTPTRHPDCGHRSRDSMLTWLHRSVSISEPPTRAWVSSEMIALRLSPTTRETEPPHPSSPSPTPSV